MTDLTDFYGPVISRYTRAQAIEDGVLIDVSDHEAAEMWKFPVAITSALHGELSVGAGKDAATFTARLRDVFHMMKLRAFARSEPDPDVFFRVKVGRRVLRLWGNIGPGDDPAPVLTVGFPEDR